MKNKTVTDVVVKDTTTKSLAKSKNEIKVQDENSVESFITLAIKQNVSVETLEKLFNLRSKVKAEQAKEAFVRAMAKFQADCPIIKKNKIVKDKYGSVRYKYASLDSIVSQTQKLIAENGLSFSFDEAKDGNMATAICKVTHELGHTEISSFQIPIGKEDFMIDAQKYGARMTFGKRYAFCNAFGILTGDEDTDENNNISKDKKGNEIMTPQPLNNKMSSIEDIQKNILLAVKQAKTVPAVMSLDQSTQKSEKFDKKFKDLVHSECNKKVDILNK